jgi:CRP-like cAMP-binding protein
MVNSLLAKLTLWSELTPDEESDLARSFGEPRRAAAGDEIVAHGSTPTVSTLVLEGFAARVTLLPEGGRQITALHIPGDFVDLHSLLLTPMDHSVVTLSPCTLTAVPHRRLRALAEAHPRLGRLLWLNTLVDGAIHRQWLAAMGRMAAAGHLAHLLCEQFLRLQAVGLTRDQTFPFPLTQVALADVLGLSSVHVNRTVQELRSDKVVSWTGGEIEILDWERLVRIAEFDPTYLYLRKMPV